jgi:hypothetical protein
MGARRTISPSIPSRRRSATFGSRCGASTENLLRVQDARETYRPKRIQGNAGPLIDGADQQRDLAVVHELLVAVFADLDIVRGHAGFD